MSTLVLRLPTQVVKRFPWTCTILARILTGMTIQEITKAEIHSHLELVLRRSTIEELAPQFGIELKSEQDYFDRFVITEPMNDLGAVLNKFLDTQKLLASEEILDVIGDGRTGQ